MSETHSDRFTNMGRFEPWFQRRFTITWQRLIAKFVIVGLVCATVGFTFGLTVDKAAGAEPASGGPSYRCVTHDGDPCPAPYAAKKFRHHKMGRVHGVNPARVWKHPAAAKRVWIRKIKRARAHGRVSTAYRGMTAAQIYKNAMSDATCAGHGTYSPYSYGFDVCTIQGPETKLTTKDIQNTGAVIFCGGGVALGAVTSEVGGWMIGWGAASCMWGAWIAASN